MVSRHIVLSSVFFSLALVAGCAQGPTPGPDTTAPEETGCFVEDPAGGGSGPITVSLTDTVEAAHAPIPQNESERLLFRHLYGTLIEVDCLGEVLPGIAGKWQVHDKGRRFDFEIRSDARFSDGTPVLARHVRSSWASALRLGVLPASWIDPQSPEVLDNRRIRVRLRVPMGIELFAHPGLAVVTDPSADGFWPIGTGPYRPDSDPSSDTLLCLPNPRHPSPGRSPLRFAVTTGADPRDLLSAGTDAVLTREREIVEYATSLPDRIAVSLPWDTMHLVVSAHLLPREGGAADSSLWAFREEVSSNIMVSSAQPIDSFDFTGGSEPDCSIPPPEESMPAPPPKTAPDRPRILFRAGDPDAERIASRMVALEDSEADTMGVFRFPYLEPVPLPVAEGLSRERFAAALRAGNDWVYVVDLRRQFPDPCLDLSRLLVNSPWMVCLVGGCGPAEVGGNPVDLQFAAIPLATSRSYFICRSTLTGIELAWDGIPLLGRATWIEQASP